MEDRTLRLLIQSKLAAGQLPQDGIPRMWVGPANGECCDACEETIHPTPPAFSRGKNRPAIWWRGAGNQSCS